MTSIAPSESADAPEPTTLSRLRHTPLRDLLRGRLSGRLDYRFLIASSGLPLPVRQLIVKVTRRTRLWRSEKADVAQELIAHFTDGLDTGRPVHETISAFGDPHAAARLIRRAKKRQRPLPWHALRYAALTLAACVMLYGASILYYLTGSPSVTTDYRPTLNAAALSVPQDQRAWPLYRRALLKLDSDSYEELKHAFNRHPRPGEDGWNEVLAFLECNRQPISLVRQAAQRLGLGFPVGYALDEEDLELWPEEPPDPVEMIISIRLPHLGELRTFAKVLMLDAQHAASAGDGETVLADLHAVLGMARQAREAPFIISDLVSLSLVSLVTHTLGDILAQRPETLTEDQLRDLAHLIASTDDCMRMRVDGERMMLLDIVQRIYTDDGAGDGRITHEGLELINRFASKEFHGSADILPITTSLAIPAIQVIAPSRSETLAECDHLFALHQAEAARPLWEADHSRVDRQIRQWKSTALGTIRHALPTMLMPAFHKAYLNRERAVARRDGLLVALALELYRRQHDDWPPSLDPLVPALLPAIPPDRFDGQPIRYALVDGSPVVYSVGTDRDDDGARPAVPRYRSSKTDVPPRWVPTRASRWIPRSALHQREDVPDGDWILWPREVEPLLRHPNLPRR